MWNFRSQSLVLDAAVVSSPFVSAVAFVGPTVQPQSSSGVAQNDENVQQVRKPNLPKSSTGVDTNVAKDQPSAVPNHPQSSTVVPKKHKSLSASKPKHLQSSVVVTKVLKARFVGADGKLSLAKGIPIHLPDHVILLKSNTVDPAPSVALESSYAPVQPNAPAPSISPTSVASSGSQHVAARVVAPSRTGDHADLFHVFEPEKAVCLSFEASHPTG
jgi:hypothetical protein